MLYKEGEKSTAIYLIKEGLVQESYKNERDYRRPKGRISNLANILNPLQLNQVTAKCIQPTSVAVIKKGKP